MAATTKRVLLSALVLFFPITFAGVLLVANTVHSSGAWWVYPLWVILLPSSLVASLLDHIAQEHLWFMHFVVWPLAAGVQYGYCVALVLLVRRRHNNNDVQTMRSNSTSEEGKSNAV
jgi:hypothetical protein